MGLFGKKRVEEPEVENLTAADLDKEPSAESSEKATDQEDEFAASETEHDSGSVSDSATEQTPHQAPIPLMSKKAPAGSYGFAQVRDLMRSIPLAENRELVVQVVKKTLESANISLQAIMQDAGGIQEEAKAKINYLKQTMADLNQEIANHKRDMVELEKELADITRIKDLLELAENLENTPSDSDRTSGASEKRRSTYPPGKPLYKSSLGQKK